MPEDMSDLVKKMMEEAQELAGDPMLDYLMLPEPIKAAAPKEKTEEKAKSESETKREDDPDKIETAVVPVPVTSQIEPAVVPVQNASPIEQGVIRDIVDPAVEKAALPQPEIEQVEQHGIPVQRQESIENEAVPVPSQSTSPESERVNESATERIDRHDIEIPAIPEIPQEAPSSPPNASVEPASVSSHTEQRVQPAAIPEIGETASFSTVTIEPPADVSIPQASTREMEKAWDLTPSQPNDPLPQYLTKALESGFDDVGQKIASMGHVVQNQIDEAMSLLQQRFIH